MFIKPTRQTVRGKTYTQHLLVESVRTPKGSRHRVLGSLGSLAPAPRATWLGLAQRIQAAATGQASFWPDAQAEALATKMPKRPRRSRPRRNSDSSPSLRVLADQIEIREAREAGAVHVGHHSWLRLGLARPI